MPTLEVKEYLGHSQFLFNLIHLKLYLWWLVWKLHNSCSHLVPVQYIDFICFAQFWSPQLQISIDILFYLCFFDLEIKYFFYDILPILQIDKLELQYS